MDAAALVLLISGVGVGFGWQPMPDGTPRYEYVVQVEPELAATLRDGQAIPIVGEVPEEIHPIARVRVVVGRGELPRRRLVTALKPADVTIGGAPLGQSVHQVQYNQTAPRTYAPGAEAERYAMAAAEWNGGGATPAGVAPPAQSPAIAPGAASDWNSGASEVADGPLERVGQGLDQVGQPLRNGLERVDNRLRDAAGNLGDRTRALGDRTRQLLDNVTQPAGSAARLPAGTDDPGYAAAPAWNGSTPPGTAPPGTTPPLPSGAYRDQGISAQTDTSWNQPPGSGPTGTPAPTTPTPLAGGVRGETNDGGYARQDPTQWNSVSTPGRENPLRTSTPGGGQPDPFATATDPRLRGGAPGSAAREEPPRSDASVAGPGRSVFGGDATPWNQDGPQIPDLGAQTGPGQSTTGAHSPTGPVRDAFSAFNDPPQHVAVPKVDVRMLDLPSDRPLDSSEADRQAAASFAGSSAPPTPTFQPHGPASVTLDAAAQGWDRPAAPQQAANGQTVAGGRDHAAVALLAWVLLSSSVAGNFYLFWSYLDVRTKYRSLVRKTARAVSRFSAA